MTFIPFNYIVKRALNTDQIRMNHNTIFFFCSDDIDFPQSFPLDYEHKM